VEGVGFPPFLFDLFTLSTIKPLTAQSSPSKGRLGTGGVTHVRTTERKNRHEKAGARCTTSPLMPSVRSDSGCVNDKSKIEIPTYQHRLRHTLLTLPSV
jgi:hypothetical protein